VKIFEKDGWLKTGDVGELTQNGMLKIIDRVKNMAKTLKGECIALEKVDRRKTFLTLARSYLS